MEAQNENNKLVLENKKFQKENQNEETLKSNYNIKDNNNNEFIKLKSEIKSNLIKKKIFSYLDEDRKLKMIIYNKYYQNLLNINTEKYINISQRPIKGGKNGYGKEYLIISNYYYFVYEGEYLNYKRNGKGKEYFPNGNVKFEGEIK
jgi:hypothetical protein